MQILYCASVLVVSLVWHSLYLSCLRVWVDALSFHTRLTHERRQLRSVRWVPACDMTQFQLLGFGPRSNQKAGASG